MKKKDSKLNTSVKSLPPTLFAVYMDNGDWEGTTIHAICESSELAEKARIRLSAELQIPLTKFKIAQVTTNTVHLWGILVQDDNFDLEEKKETS